ncbi:MAG: hypothetical protein ACLP59_33835, partial [Bryobacteraceae bacterium]
GLREGNSRFLPYSCAHRGPERNPAPGSVSTAKLVPFFAATDTKETALATLEELHYEILDYFYTPRCIELAKQMIQKIAVLPRMLCFAIHPDLTVRVLGGYSLLVLAR